MTEQPESAVEVLKPCPFCGGQAAFVPCEAGSSVGQVFCQECDTSAGEYQTAFGLIEDAEKAWNTRATQPAEAQGAGDWMLVPRVPTPEIIAAIRAAKKSGRLAEGIWQEALAAAPQAPAGGEAERMRGALLRILAEDTPAGTGGGTGGGLKMAAIAREGLAAAPTPQRADAEDVERYAAAFYNAWHERKWHMIGEPLRARYREGVPAALSALAALPRASQQAGRTEREEGQAEGFAAAVQWLRERSAMRPPATLWHAAEILADQMEQSRQPAREGRDD